MAASALLLPELEHAVGRGSPTRRAVTLERVTTLFLADAERFSPEQVQVFDDVIGRLIAEIEERALAALSQRLAPVGNAPREVVRRLARHDDIAIAGPVLRLSGRLSDDDLVAIARSKGQAHLLAIANRGAIDPVVTDVLVQRGDREVTRDVAANAGAALSEAAFSALVQRAGQDGILAERVGSRDDIPPHLFRRLVLQAVAVVQARLLSQATPQARAEIQRVLAKVSDDVGGPPRDYANAQARVAALAAGGKLNEAALAAFAKAGDFEATVAALAALCGVSIEVTDRLLGGSKADPVLVLCKAAHYRWATAAAVLSLRLRAGSPALDSALEQYGRLSVASAQRVLHFWRARPAGISVSVAEPLRA